MEFTAPAPDQGHCLPQGCRGSRASCTAHALSANPTQSSFSEFSGQQGLRPEGRALRQRASEASRTLRPAYLVLKTSFNLNKISFNCNFSLKTSNGATARKTMVTIQLNTVVLKETASETTVHLLSNLAQFFESSSSHWSQNQNLVKTMGSFALSFFILIKAKED